MDNMSLEEIVRKLHETGNATRDLMAKTTVASGAVIGGPATPPPPIATTPAPGAA